VRKDVLFVQGAGKGAHEADGLLATSLQRALGAGYVVCFPKMPNEEDPDLSAWASRIATELTASGAEVILVGHSLGALTLLKYLADHPLDRLVAGLYLLAAPSRDDADWNYAALELPRDIAARLSGIPRIFLYHSRDDEIVPFAHLTLHARRLPKAIIRITDGRGHQFGNDLADVAADIRDSASA
jgi:predicted alpha/beta hydrolase family esterase